MERLGKDQGENRERLERDQGETRERLERDQRETRERLERDQGETMERLERDQRDLDNLITVYSQFFEYIHNFIVQPYDSISTTT